MRDITRQVVFEWVKNEYCIVMDVTKCKFGLESDELIDVLNVKADEMLIDVLVEKTGFYRAYHMNKTKWISIFGDGTVEEETIKNLIADSYKNTSKKEKKQC